MTVDITDALFRRVKARAAEHGVALREFVCRALADHLQKKSQQSAEPLWMKAFGGLRDLHDETQRVDQIVPHEFNQLDAEDWILHAMRFAFVGEAQQIRKVQQCALSVQH